MPGPPQREDRRRPVGGRDGRAERLAAVRHHQLFFVGMHYRRRPTPSARRRGGRRGAPRKPPPAPAWRRIPAGGSSRCSRSSLVTTAGSARPTPT
ncbi:hypothetical protein ACR6C2_40315 [Streptomyces sp. INA 01156]